MVPINHNITAEISKGSSIGKRLPLAILQIDRMDHQRPRAKNCDHTLDNAARVHTASAGRARQSKEGPDEDGHPRAGMLLVLPQRRLPEREPPFRSSSWTRVSCAVRMANDRAFSVVRKCLSVPQEFAFTWPILKVNSTFFSPAMP